MLAAVTTRPRASLARILDDLGTTLLELICGSTDEANDIGGIVIHDPLDEPALPRQALMLGVGVDGAERTAALLRDLGRRGGAGLVVRAPAPTGPQVTDAARESGVALLALTRGASWTQLAALLRSLLAEGDVVPVEPEMLGGMPSGDLFALANAIAALVDAPVTIEDRSSRVLAFSGRQDEADPSRVETVLGRQVPERYTQFLVEQGVFRELYRGDQPVYVWPPDEDWADFQLPRVAVAVRAGEEVLGSIWAAVPGSLSEDRLQALRDAAKVVALHLLRIRAGADVAHRLRADLIGTALEGGAGALEAASRLGLTGYAAVVLALAPPGDGDGAVVHRSDAALVTEMQRLADAFDMHLTALHPKCSAALIGDVAFGILPFAPDRADAESRAATIGADFLERMGSRSRAVIGVGPLVVECADLTRSREGAERALRVLRMPGGSRRVARLDDVQVEALLLDLQDLARARGGLGRGPAARLAEYDRKHGTCLVDTLRAWLDAFGDVSTAAATLFVHPNTFRYRLRRLAEIGGIDLDDADQRFAAMLQLRLMTTADAPSS